MHRDPPIAAAPRTVALPRGGPTQPRRLRRAAAACGLLGLGLTFTVSAQPAGPATLGPTAAAHPAARPDALADSRAPDSVARRARSALVRAAAARATGRRLVVSLTERHLAWIDGTDTLLVAPVAIGKGTTLRHGNRQWDFSTPVGVRTVRGREASPVWVPPDWHYVEVAAGEGLRVAPLHRGRPVPLADGRRLEVRGSEIGLSGADGAFAPLQPGDELVFAGTLFVPPFGTAHRRIVGEPGRFKLDLGDGYLIHGTPDESSVGTASTHGCLRLRDADLQVLYDQVPLGTPVYIH